MVVRILIASIAIALLAWRETRHLGAARDDRELQESAPIVGGLAVGLACAMTYLLDPSLSWRVVGYQALVLSSNAMVVLLALEALLADRGLLENEWLVLPSPLDEHARASIGGDRS